MSADTFKTGLAAIGLFLLTDTIGILGWIRMLMGVYN